MIYTRHVSFYNGCVISSIRLVIHNMGPATIMLRDISEVVMNVPETVDRVLLGLSRSRSIVNGVLLSLADQTMGALVSLEMVVL